METSETVTSIYPALIECWKDFPNLKPEGKGYGYDYVELNKVLDICKKVLHIHGLAAVQFPVSNDAENIGVTTRIIHESGEWIEGTIYSSPTSMKGINKTQATGATITYLRRYGLLSIFGATGDKDTDGKSGREVSLGGKSADEFQEHLDGLDRCQTMEELHEFFTKAWQTFTDTESRRILTEKKDVCKSKL